MAKSISLSPVKIKFPYKNKNGIEKLIFRTINNLKEWGRYFPLFLAETQK